MVSEHKVLECSIFSGNIYPDRTQLLPTAQSYSLQWVTNINSFENLYTVLPGNISVKWNQGRATIYFTRPLLCIRPKWVVLLSRLHGVSKFKNRCGKRGHTKKPWKILSQFSGNKWKNLGSPKLSEEPGDLVISVLCVLFCFFIWINTPSCLGQVPGFLSHLSNTEWGI